MNPIDWQQTQCTAFSLSPPYNNFIKYKLNPIIKLPPYGINNTSGFRDPFVFKNPMDNKYYMIIGCGKKANMVQYHFINILILKKKIII